MRTIPMMFAAAAFLGHIGTIPAVAGDANSYPRVVGSGENASVEYGPGPLNNIVGGGRVVVTGFGENLELHHLDAAEGQRPPLGMLPVSRGSGENTEVVWMPAPGSENRAIARAPAPRN